MIAMMKYLTPKATILAPYGAQPYDTKDELTHAKGNNTCELQRTGMDGGAICNVSRTADDERVFDRADGLK